MPSITVPQMSAVIAEIAGIELGAVTPQSSLVDDLGLDSLGLHELVVSLQQDYGVSVPLMIDGGWGQTTVERFTNFVNELDSV